ncbi:MAG: UDP-N-acetylmuramoyl-L-alanine--D-glutamate ligase [Thermodesulfobacteriota bacterium]
MADPDQLFHGKRITVIGLGVLGRGLGDTLFLIRRGARVTVTDLKPPEELAGSLEKLRGLPVTLRLGRHDPQDFIDADMVLRNADVPRSSRFLAIAREHGVPVEMDESLFCKHFSGKVVGITGTRGKTTTTILVHKILTAGGFTAWLGGNILGCATLPLLDGAGPEDVAVLELSSWQLQGFDEARISPHASVFTNIYPDHLNRYRSMADYIEDKKAIYRHQRDDDFCLFNGDQPETAKLATEAPAGAHFFRPDNVPVSWKIRLPGLHNRHNVAAAAELTRRMGVPEDTIRRVVEEFTGVEHRLEWLGEKDGVGFVNDSTSTTPVAGMAALESMPGRRVLLIAGGADKNLDLTPFAEAAVKRCARIALLNGTATDALEKAMLAAGGKELLTGRFADLERAVHELYRGARQGDVVLLSPGCASFGLFRNEYHRGETFVAICREILNDGTSLPKG